MNHNRQDPPRLLCCSIEAACRRGKMEGIGNRMKVNLRPATEGDYDFLWWLHGVTMRTYVEAIWGWDEAAQQGIPLWLRVLQGNPARRLYERLGFVAHEGTETHIKMSWLPRTMAGPGKGESR